MLPLLAVLAMLFAAGPDRPDTLRCEYLIDPLDIDSPHPRLSWLMHDPRRGAVQRAYRVLVATSQERLARDEGDLWDSGEIRSAQTAQVEYAGRPLRSAEQAFWK